PSSVNSEDLAESRSNPPVPLTKSLLPGQFGFIKATTPLDALGPRMGHRDIWSVDRIMKRLPTAPVASCEKRRTRMVTGKIKIRRGISMPSKLLPRECASAPPIAEQ